MTANERTTILLSRPQTEIAARVAAWALVLLPSVWTFGDLRVRLTPSAYAMVATLLTLGAVTSLLLTAVAGRLHRFAALPAAYLSGVALIWVHREIFRAPRSILLFVLAATGLGAVVLLASRSVGARSTRTVAATAVASALIASCLATAAYRGDPYLRWVLLRHLRAIGTPLYFILDHRLKDATGRLREAPAQDAARQEVAALDPPPGFVQPNVVFLLVDTLRADALRPWGEPADALPTLSQLARRSAVLLDVESNSSWTRPSVASFFTGLPPEQHGARYPSESLDPRLVTLAMRFRGLGYRTAAVIGNPANVGIGAGFAAGFDEFYEMPGRRKARGQDLSRTAQRWIAGADTGKPFFLYLHFMEPHAPYLSGGDRWPTWRGDEVRGYRAEIRHLDDVLAPLLEQIERRPGRPTVTFFTSDHGQEIGDHDDFGHGHALYRELVHIPALLSGPLIRPETISSPLEARDFFDLLPRMAAGPVSLRLWASERARHIRYSSTYLLSTVWSPHRPYRSDVAVRRLDVGSLTGIWSAYGDTFEVYDRSVDPYERYNLAASDSAETRMLRTQLEEMVPRWSRAFPARLTPALKRSLRSLGYLN